MGLSRLGTPWRCSRRVPLSVVPVINLKVASAKKRAKTFAKNKLE
jgi:hypothetical protein